ncbi:MAG: hypothetical protein Q8P41_03500 [Pseudomonadota bacterium]|nr:hypothetical protein [Pseudomonadota bacterium]
MSGAAAASRSAATPVGPAPFTLALVELTWRDAPAAVRAAARAVGDASGRSTVPLHTCARAAWLCSERDATALAAHLRARIGVQAAPGAPAPTVRTGEAALRHLYRVAVGQDSLVEGEADVGLQVRDALEDALDTALGAAPHPATRTLRLLRHEVVRLLREGRLAGFVRPAVGLAEVAAAAVIELDASDVSGADVSVGVVGAGALGRRVVHALERRGLRVRLYNRTAASGALPLDRIGAGADVAISAWIIATSAPSPWFTPPRPVPVVDLGHARQCLTTDTLSLDALLARPGLRLPADRRAAAHAAVEAAVARTDRRLASPTRPEVRR